MFIRNNTQTAVTNMTIKRMLENKIHFSNMRFIVMFVTALVCVLFPIKLRGQRKRMFMGLVLQNIPADREWFRA